jgi:hypothetical protein
MATEWSDEFVERRMAEHHRLQHDAESETIRAIIDEVQTLPKRNPKSWPKSGQLFLMQYAEPQERLPQ